MNYVFLALGIFVGIVLATLMTRQKIVGTLLVDTSDPTEEPMLLLDLDRPVREFAREKYVTMRVRKSNLISQK